VVPRPGGERKADTLGVLATEDDAWVATADGDGHPHLVPLTIWWDGERLTMTTEARSRTARNLAAGGSLRLAVGRSRDVVMIDGSVALTAVGDDADVAAGFAARTGWDPRDDDGEWVFIRVRPTRVQAWREADEIAGRTLMRDGRWVV
jgi:general stress protein 26